MNTKKVAKPQSETSKILNSEVAPSAATAASPAASTPASTTASATTPAPSSSIKQLAAMRLAASLGQIVGLMMRTPQHRQEFLGDLDWLVVPALVSNQFVVHEALDPRSGIKLPVAAVLWARVSEEVDARLTASIRNRPKLKPDEWTSGSIPWLIEVVGDQKTVRTLVKALVEKRFKETGLKTYARGADGKPTVTVLQAKTDAAELKKAVPAAS